MIQVRKSLFETNSSSTHAVVVHKHSDNKVEPVTEYLDDNNFLFGRQLLRILETITEKFAYAYIVVKDMSEYKKTPNDVKKFLDIFFKVAKPYFDVEINEFDHNFVITEQYMHKLIKLLNKKIEKADAWVDHIEDFETNGFYDKLISDEDFVRRLIFDEESYITIGGDEYQGYYIKPIGFEDDYNSKYKKSFEQIYDEEGYPTIVDPSEIYNGPFWTKVKKYKEKFEVFFKGN